MTEREDKIENESQQTQRGKAKRGILSALGGVNRRGRDYSDNVDIALAKLGAQYNTDYREAKTGSDRGKELPEQGEKACGHRYRTQNLNKEDSQLARDKCLLKNSVITREQFKKKWNSKE